MCNRSAPKARSGVVRVCLSAVPVELKAVDVVLPVHSAQILTYMRITGLRKGLLFNFNVPVLKQGIKSFVL